MQNQSEEIKTVIQNNVDKYTTRLLNLQKSLNEATIQMENDRIRCHNMWFAGPDQICIKLNKCKVSKLVRKLARDGKLSKSVKFEFQWRTYSGDIELKQGRSKYCDSESPSSEFKLKDEDLEVVSTAKGKNGAEIKQTIINANGKVYTRKKGKVVEVSDSDSNDSENKSNTK